MKTKWMTKLIPLVVLLVLAGCVSQSTPPRYVALNPSEYCQQVSEYSGGRVRCIEELVAYLRQVNDPNRPFDPNAITVFECRPVGSLEQVARQSFNP